MTPMRCPAQTALTSAELRALEALPDPVNELDLVLRCELQAEHRGEHMSLGQTDNRGHNWWLSWPAGDRLLQALPTCPATIGEDVHEEPCTLPMGHDGVHDYELLGDRPWIRPIPN